MWPLDVFGLFVLVLTLGTLLVIVLLLAGKRSGKQVSLWLASSLVGMLLGAGGLAALTKGLGYELVDTSPEAFRIAATAAPNSAAAPTGAASGGMPGMGGGPGSTGMPAMGGGGPPGMGGMGGGMGGNRGPSPKRQLTTLVRKLDLLSGNIGVKLTTEQAAAIVSLVAGLDELDQFSDDEAKLKYEGILAILSDDQKAQEEAIGLPMRRPAGGGGFGGGPQDPNANPFREEENSTALKSLRGRISSADTAATDGEAATKVVP